MRKPRACPRPAPIMPAAVCGAMRTAKCRVARGRLSGVDGVGVGIERGLGGGIACAALGSQRATRARPRALDGRDRERSIAASCHGGPD
jgi:hypothetical protein